VSAPSPPPPSDPPAYESPAPPPPSLPPSFPPLGGATNNNIQQAQTTGTPVSPVTTAGWPLGNEVMIVIILAGTFVLSLLMLVCYVVLRRRRPASKPAIAPDPADEMPMKPACPATAPTSILQSRPTMPATPEAQTVPRQPARPATPSVAFISASSPARLPPPLTPAQPHNLLDLADQNGDGMLSRAEFATFLAAAPPPTAARYAAATAPTLSGSRHLHASTRSTIHPIGGPPRGAVSQPPGQRSLVSSRSAVLSMEASDMPKSIIYPSQVFVE